MESAGADHDEDSDQWNRRIYQEPSVFEEEGNLIGYNFVPNNVSAFSLAGGAHGYSAPQELQQRRRSSYDESLFTTSHIDPLSTGHTHHQYPHPRATHALPGFSASPLRTAHVTANTTQTHLARPLGRLSGNQALLNVPQLESGPVHGSEHRPHVAAYALPSVATDGYRYHGVHPGLVPASGPSELNRGDTSFALAVTETPGEAIPPNGGRLKRKKGGNLRKAALSTTPTHLGLLGGLAGP
ncbi:hypothetical protein LTR95_015360, partial [Oleoguttula sp. CCFEE 5521]